MQIEYGKLDEQLFNLERMVLTIESEAAMVGVFESLKTGNAALQAIHEAMSLEDVEELMLDTEEAVATQEQMTRILGEIGEGVAINEDEIEDEYTNLVKEGTEEVAKVKKEDRLYLPDVPTDVVQSIPTSLPGEEAVEEKKISENA